MTCKNCIHSGLCYKENDYANFPDRCGDFISDKVLEERPKGEWRDGYGGEYLCTNCFAHSESLTPFCRHCGAKMKGGEEVAKQFIDTSKRQKDEWYITPDKQITIEEYMQSLKGDS